MRKPRYATLQGYLERTGTTQRQLLTILRVQFGLQMSPALLNMIVKGNRRCVARNAFALHMVTGVPMDELTRWPRYQEPVKSQSVA